MKVRGHTVTFLDPLIVVCPMTSRYSTKSDRVGISLNPFFKPFNVNFKTSDLGLFGYISDNLFESSISVSKHTHILVTPMQISAG